MWIQNIIVLGFVFFLRAQPSGKASSRWKQTVNKMNSLPSFELAITSSMPASNALCSCSLRAFPVSAIILCSVHNGLSPDLKNENKMNLTVVEVFFQPFLNAEAHGWLPSLT